MKYLDRVKLMTNKFENVGLKKGAVGRIIMPVVDDVIYAVGFYNKNWDYTEIFAYVGDLVRCRPKRLSKIEKEDNLVREQVRQELKDLSKNK